MKQNQNKKITLALSFLILSLFMVAQAYAVDVRRSNFIVSNLSCTSCLATIEAELKGLPGTIGMDADLQKSRVTVDHQPELDSEKIASAITSLGYPAELNWTATVPDQYVARYQQRSKYSSGGCSSGGCSSSGGAANDTTTWKDAPASGTVSRTTLQVNNLSCTSCLNAIAGELSKVPETYGMKGYLSRGIVIVDHTDTLETSRIAAIISDLGYPARAIASNEVPAQKAFSTTPRNKPSNQIRQSGIGCNSNSPCNATAASWQKLYNRYFTQTK